MKLTERLTPYQVKAALEELIESTGWKLLIENMEEQTAIRMGNMMQPANGVDGMVAKEFLAGEIHAYTAIAGVPLLLIETAEINLKIDQTRQTNAQNPFNLDEEEP